LVAAVIRRVAGAAAIVRYKTEIDGVNILVMFVFVGAVMENLAASLIAAPMRMLGLAALAFALCFAVLGVTIVMFTLGFMASQRNMGLMLAATGGILPDVTWLWFAMCQFPIYLTPHLFKPMVRLCLPAPHSAESAG
jgi:hypothetical protein